jgi:hypothetical protein
MKGKRHPKLGISGQCQWWSKGEKNKMSIIARGKPPLKVGMEATNQFQAPPSLPFMDEKRRSPIASFAAHSLLDAMYQRY